MGRWNEWFLFEIHSISVEEEKLKKFEEEKKTVDIGFPPARMSRSEETKLKLEHRQNLKKNSEFEKLSRYLKCKEHFNSFGLCFVHVWKLIIVVILVQVDADRVKEDWLEAEGQFQIKSIAQHYGIYEHLFGYAYFLPRVKLDIKVRSDTLEI